MAKKATVEVVSSTGVAEIDVRIDGLSPLIPHNILVSLDPDHLLSKEVSKITRKRSKDKTPSDRSRIKMLEWLSGAYTDDDGYVIVPGANLEAMLRDGAKKVRLGKAFQSAVFVDGNPRLEFPDMKLTSDTLSEMEQYRLSVPVKVGQAKVIRTRPLFREWACAFKVQVDTSVVETEQVVEALTTAGRIVGLMDWRPRNGRFAVTVK